MGLRVTPKSLSAKVGVVFSGRRPYIFAAIALMLLSALVAYVTTRNVSADAINTTDFVITVKTDNAGTSNSTSFTLPIATGAPTNYNVDWNNDGVPDQTGITATSVTHDFGVAGTYKIRISGNYAGIYFNNGGDKLKIISIDQWGTNAWRSMARAFYGCTNLVSNATDTANTTAVNSLTYTFTNAANFNGNISGWNTSNVVNMSYAFHGAAAFNQPIGSWNTSKVTTMANLFTNATAFNQPIGAWDTSKVTSMINIFYNAPAFNQPLNAWNVSNVTAMSNAFYSAAAFNQPLNNWNTSKVTNMSNMFLGATVFNQPLGSWDVSKVTNMSSMFRAATSFNQPLNSWDVSKVTNMSIMFYGATAFNQPLNNWNTSSVTTMSNMFMLASNFNQPIGSWNTSNVTLLDNMFNQASSFNQPIGTWDTSKVTNMANTFSYAFAFNQPLDTWNTSNVTNMSYTFFHARAFDQPLGSWDTSKVTTMAIMFYGALVFDQPIGNWNTSNVTTMASMFLNAAKFNQPIGSWNTGNVTNMATMFQNATVFNQPIAGWDVSKVTNMGSMFNAAYAFNQPLNSWDTSSVTNISGFLYRALAYDQPLGNLKMHNVTSAGNMLSNTKLSVINYDSTLVGWSSQTLQPNITVGANSLRYCGAQAQRTSIIATYSWTFTSDGKACPPPTITITAPTKILNSPINNTTIMVTETFAGVGIDAANITVGAGTTAGRTGFACTQVTPASASCTISITSSGNLQIRAVNSEGAIATALETGYIIDTVLPSSIVSLDTSSSIHTPTISFTATDNIAVARTDIIYSSNNGTAGVGAPVTITNASSPTSLVLDPDEAVHTITVRTYDTAGNYYDNTVLFPPIINFTVPTSISNAPINSATVTISAPSGNPITNIALANGGSAATLTNCVGAGGDTTQPYNQPVTCSIQNVNISSTLTVTAMDSGNGAIGRNQASFIIEAVAPTISVVAPQKLHNSAITTTVVTVTDSHAIQAANVAISATSQTGGFALSNTNCTQTNATTVTCTLQINGTEGTGDIRISAQDTAGNTSTYTETGYQIDTTAPTVTVNTSPGQASPTNINSASFTIVFSEPVSGFTEASMLLQGTSGSVTSLTTVDNRTFIAIITGMTSGDTVTASLAADVAHDAAGNTTLASTSTGNSVTYDTAAPAVTVNPVLVNSASPALSGTVSDPAAIIRVSINGITYTATNNGDGTWNLAANAIIPALTDGTYDIIVTAEDQAGNIGTDTTLDELTIDTVPPTGSVATIAPSTNTSPALSGAVDEPTTLVFVTVNGTRYPTMNNGDGTWSLAAGTISPALNIGSHTITVTFEDLAGNTFTTTSDLTIQAPVTQNPETPTTPLTPSTGFFSAINGFLPWVLTGLTAIVLALASILIIRKRHHSTN